MVSRITNNNALHMLQSMHSKMKQLGKPEVLDTLQNAKGKLGLNAKDPRYLGPPIHVKIDPPRFDGGPVRIKPDGGRYIGPPIGDDAAQTGGGFMAPPEEEAVATALGESFEVTGQAEARRLNIQPIQGPRAYNDKGKPVLETWNTDKMFVPGDPV